MTEGFVEVAGTRLLVRRWGDAGAPPVLFWHGGGGASSEVRQFAPALAAAGYAVYAPDAPGYGRSPPVDASRYRPSALAELAVALMDALGLAHVVWVGSSWGATLGVHTAGRFPKRFTGLVLLDAGYIDARDDPNYDPSLALEKRIAGLRARLEKGEVWDATPELIATAMHAGDAEPCSPVLPSLNGTGIAILLVRATEPPESEPLRIRGVERFHAALPAAEVVPVRGVGHFLLRDAEPSVETIVVDWLARRA